MRFQRAICSQFSPTIKRELIGVHFGYAGGLSPANIAEQLGRIEATAPGRTLWVDMESSLRTRLKEDEGDIFDANKAMACVRAVIEHGLAPN